MRTHLEFRSDAFPPYPGEEEQINPGVYGKRLAEFLAEELPAHGLTVTRVHAEDWGWRIALRHDAFSLWIGCANYEEDEPGFLCFIEPSRPHIRRWFRKIDTTAAVEELAHTLETIIAGSGRAHDLRWWAEDEIGR